MRGSRIQKVGLLVVGAIVALGVVALLAGCGAQAREFGAAEESVQKLLELRAGRSVDASAYAEFLEPALAQELANASQIELQAETTITPTPNWEQPYLSAEDGDASDVVVVWIADDDHSDWPTATVFKMQLVDDRWLATDANAVEGTATVPAPLN